MVLGEGDDVQVFIGVQQDLLGGGDLLNGPDPVPEPCRPFKIQILRRFFHLLLQVADGGNGAVLDVIHRFPHQLLVLLLAHLPLAQAKAPVNVVIQAGAAPAEFLGEPLRAAGQAEHPVCFVHALLDDVGADIRPQIGPVPVLLLGGGDAGVIPAGDVDVVVALVVLEQDVVFGAVELNEAAFQHQGLEFAAGDNVVKIVDVGHHLPHLFRVGAVFPEVADHPVF